MRFSSLITIAIALAACKRPRATVFGDKYFSHWDDRRVLCSMGADKAHHWSLDDLRAAIDRAAAEGSVIHTYGHAPTFDLDEYLPLFMYAHARGVDFVTYAELADRDHPRAGWAFSIDDTEVDTWYSWRDKLRAAGVHLTFFVAGYEDFTPAQRDELHKLAADGHDIEPHGLHHVQAVAYTEAHGVAAYITDDVVPDLAAFKRDGFSPKAFSYPFGNHTPEIDTAMLEHVQLVRGASSRSCY